MSLKFVDEMELSTFPAELWRQFKDGTLHAPLLIFSSETTKQNSLIMGIKALTWVFKELCPLHY